MKYFFFKTNWNKWKHKTLWKTYFPMRYRYLSILYFLPIISRNDWESNFIFLLLPLSTGESHGEAAWQATVHGVTRVGHDLTTKQSNNQQPLSNFLVAVISHMM